MTGCIVGWAHSKFGKIEGQDVEALIVEAATNAVADAGVGPDDIDAIYLGYFNNGFADQDFPSSLVLQADERFRFGRQRVSRMPVLRDRLPFIRASTFSKPSKARSFWWSVSRR